MSTEARRSTLEASRSVQSIDLEGADNPYSIWTCSLARGERELGMGIIVRLDSDDELLSLLPCLGTKFSNQKIDLETDYALLTCHSNLDVVREGELKHFNLEGLQASARDNDIALEDCVSCAVSCCGPNSMLMLSKDVPAAFTLLPHTSGPCPIGYDFVILFLNERFKPGEITPPPVVNVSQCLNLDGLRNFLERQSGAQTRNTSTINLYSRRNRLFNVVPVKVRYSKEQRMVKRFCDEIDWYSEHQRLNYSLTNHSPDSQSFHGAPIICKHEGRRYLMGISSTGVTGEQVVTLYGICQFLSGGPVPLFAAMRHPSPRTLSPNRWSDHILTHLATMAQKKGHLLEIFHLLLEKEEAALVNLIVADRMNVSVSAMKILTEILKKFSGPEELTEVIKESPPNKEDDFKECILRVCRRLKAFMQHFSSIQRGENPEKILESVFHLTVTMLIWNKHYPDVTEWLLSNENIESASKAADTYTNSPSITSSFRTIRHSRDKMVERDLIKMRLQIAALQKELREKEQEVKNKQRSEDRRSVPLEEEKERRMSISEPAPKRAKQDPIAAGKLRAEVLSVSPTLKKLKLLRGPDGQTVEIVNTVASKWKEVGIDLDFDDAGQHLETIESTYDKEPVQCCQAMFRHWLKGNGEEQTWLKLIEILQDCKLGALAESVEEILMAYNK